MKYLIFTQVYKSYMLLNMAFFLHFSQVAGKLAGGKLSMAAIGNLCTVPYIDELK